MVVDLKGYLPPEKGAFFRDLGHEPTAEVLQWYEFTLHLHTQ